MIINGHKVERRTATTTMDIIYIDGEGKLQQVDFGKGRIELSGKAWDQQQKDLILETFPNLHCREEFRGSGTWLFRSTPFPY